jgi:hypothetical protein
MQAWYLNENPYPFVPQHVLDAADSVRGSLPNKYCDPKLAADLFEEVLERAGGDGSAVGGTEPLAVAFVGAGESLGGWLLQHPEEPADAVADRLMNVAWLGLHGLLQRRGAEGLRSVASG